jgi:hypothetical protein
VPEGRQGGEGGARPPADRDGLTSARA